jgi:polyhydroxyalkanoate synthase
VTQKIFPPDSKLGSPAEGEKKMGAGSLGDTLMELEEVYRKLKKMRSTLYAAGDVEVGNTPHETIDETRIYRLLHYMPMVSRTAKTPLLLVYALINRSYILDLQPDKSWIRSLLKQGFDVYLIDWKPPSSVDKYVSFDDYVNYYMDDCLDIVLDKSFTDKVTLHGYCMGSTMSVMYATLHEEKVRNLATIAPVIDSEKDTTVLANFSKCMDFENMFNSLGNMPQEQLHLSFSALKPFKQGVNKYLNLIDQKNLLINNEMKLGREIIDLSKIRMPVLNIIAEEDHLVSPGCSASLNDVISSRDKRIMRFHTGHVGLIASNYSQNNVLPKVGQWLRSRSQ